MEKRVIGLRAQDIQTGLQEVQVAGPAAGLLDTTLLVGMACRLAIHIRGVDIIDDERRLYLLGDRIGINSLVLPTVLELLEEAEFASIERSQGRIKRISERVPYFGNIYDRLGEIWEDRNPHEVEQATIQILDNLVDGPRALNHIRSDYSLDASDFDTLLRVGQEGGYLSNFKSPTDNSAVVYSPLYWEEKPEETFQLIMRYGAERIVEAVRKVRTYQGMPMPALRANSTDNDRVIVEAMAAGLLPSPEVKSFRGPKQFAFTPYTGQVNLGDTERPILQKARAILACIRYGEHLGTITHVRDPAAIIRALQYRGSIGPHTEIAMQYAMLVVEGVARITRDPHHRGRYNLEITDRPENVRALNIAADMLRIGEAITDRGLNSAARGLLFHQGMFRDPNTTRSEVIRTGQDIPYSDASIKRDIIALIDDVRQV